MPPTRYQVFLSATYDDLEEDRLRAILGVMRIRQFPVGMEVLTASDDRGWRQIQKMIDTSDYYVLIVGGRYGSVDPGTGVSWTEREYDYATSRGIKRLAFIRRDTAITRDKIDRGVDAADKQERLERFKKKLDAHHLAFWETTDELVGKVQEGMTNQIAHDQEDGELPVGWVRGGGAPIAIAEELARLSEENRVLREELAAFRGSQSVNLVIRAFGDAVIPRPEYVLEPEKRDTYGIAFISDPGRASREEVVKYLDKRGRACWVTLVVENTGTTAARDVEVRVKITNVEDVDTALPLPGPFSAGGMLSPHRTGATNVTIEPEEIYDNTAHVTQRVKLIAPENDAPLVPLLVVAQPLEGVPLRGTIKVEVTAVDSSGHRAQATFEYVIQREGRQVEKANKYW